MKKSIIFVLALFLASIVMADENNLIKLDVPSNLNIKDNIILLNNSSCTILRSAVVLMDKNEEVVLGICNIVVPGGSVVLASYDKNGLKHLRGKRIGVKVKGVKKRIVDSSVTSVGGYAGGSFAVGVSHADVNANELNNITDEDITYEFTASLSEAHHDLYINIYDNQEGGGVLNF